MVVEEKCLEWIGDKCVKWRLDGGRLVAEVEEGKCSIETKKQLEETLGKAKGFSIRIKKSIDE